MFRFKGLLLFVIGVFSMSLSSNLYAQNDSWSAVQEQGSGAITLVYYELDGFAYENEQGEVTGVGIDIFKQFVNYLNNGKGISLDVNYVKYDDFSKLYGDVRDGESGIFGMANVTITEARKQELDFSPPYMTNIAVMVTHDQVPELSALEALPQEFAGKNGLMFAGTTHEDRMRALKSTYYPQLSLQEANSNAEVIDGVTSNPDLFGYVDLTVFWMAQQREKPIKRHAVGDQASEKFGFIMPKDSDWKPVMNEFFNLGGGYRSNSAYRSILVKHLGAEMTKMLEMARK